jgi:sporulation protein YlmC with PRC-barrel domain
MDVKRFEQWVGTEVIDRDGATVGKLEEVYFNGDSPTIALVRNGRVLKHRYVVPLKDAAVTRDSVLVAFAEGQLLEAADGSHGLSAADVDGLRDAYGVQLAVPLEQLEGSQERSERLLAEAEAERRARELEADAARKAQDAEQAAADAHAATAAARTAEEQRIAAERDAEQARREAP